MGELLGVATVGIGSGVVVAPGDRRGDVRSCHVLRVRKGMRGAGGGWRRLVARVLVLVARSSGSVGSARWVFVLLRGVVLLHGLGTIVQRAIGIRVRTCGSGGAGEVVRAVVVVQVTAMGSGLLVLLKVLFLVFVAHASTALHNLHDDEDHDQEADDCGDCGDSSDRALVFEEATQLQMSRLSADRGKARTSWERQQLHLSGLRHLTSCQWASEQ